MQPKENPILQYIAQGEHRQQDFKFEISDARKIARSLSAFANTDGGRLLVGVKDNGKIAGVHSDEEAYMIEAAGTLYCSPAVTCTITSHVVEGKTVLMVQVPRSEHRPVYVLQEDAHRTAYLRIADENILATPVHLQLWQSEQTPKGVLFPFTEREQTLLHVMQCYTDGITLNRLCRKVPLSRPRLITLLAQLIRYDIVETEFVERQFIYKLRGQ